MLSICQHFHAVLHPDVRSRCRARVSVGVAPVSTRAQRAQLTLHATYTHNTHNHTQTEVGIAVAPDASTLVRAMLPLLLSELFAPVKFKLCSTPLDATWLPYEIITVVVSGRGAECMSAFARPACSRARLALAADSGHTLLLTHPRPAFATCASSLTRQPLAPAACSTPA